MLFRIYRFDPDKDAKPYMKDYDIELQAPGEKPVTIGDMEFLGSFWRTTLTGGALGDVELTAQFSINAVRRLALKAGKDILVELPADRLRAFPDRASQ